MLFRLTRNRASQADRAYYPTKHINVRLCPRKYLLLNSMITPITTPNGWQFSTNFTKCSSDSSPQKSCYFGSSIIQPFKPYSGNPLDPIDICVDDFLNSPTFELICLQAIQLATVLPRSPPPRKFVTFEASPMHQWYQALLMEFVETFMRRLRVSNLFPIIYNHSNQSGIPTDAIYDNEQVFNHEATAHMNAILASFNSNSIHRGCYNTQQLSIDISQPNAIVAALALQETITPADYAPKNNWRVGEPLHPEYRRRLRMFEAGVTRLMAERNECRWILGLPDKLKRGIDAYKEHYIACLRDEIARFRSGGNPVLDAATSRTISVREDDDVFT